MLRPGYSLKQKFCIFCINFEPGSQAYFGFVSFVCVFFKERFLERPESLTELEDRSSLFFFIFLIVVIFLFCFFYFFYCCYLFFCLCFYLFFSFLFWHLFCFFLRAWFFLLFLTLCLPNTISFNLTLYLNISRHKNYTLKAF